MILSLEEEEEEELQDAAHNVVTLDGEIMAVNGRILAGRKFNPGLEPDAVSVCSCTCYGNKSSKDGNKTIFKQQQSLKRGGKQTGSSRRNPNQRPIYIRIWNGILRFVGFPDPDSTDSDGNYYDEETQSINNYARFAVKRASF
jgi:hypothetical protein